MRFTLRKTVRFEAAHRLPHHDGKCARLHGHSWRLHLEVAGETLQPRGPKQGMLLDFADLGAALMPLLEHQLDHHYLNDTTGLESPTSEALCQWVYDQLPAILRPQVRAVTIEETCTASCRYEPPPGETAP